MSRFRRRTTVVAVAALLTTVLSGTAYAAAAATATAATVAGVTVAGVTTASASQPSVLGLKAADGAQVVSENWLDARTVDIKVTSPVVWAAPIPVRLIMPTNYSSTSGRTYPLVFMLHGGDDDYTSWTRETDIAKVSAGYDAIVVMSDAGRNATYTNYFRPYDGNPLQWETFHTKELPQILEQGYKANTNWAIAGISSGGYGAFAYASRNPGLFKYAASYSGPVAIRLPLIRTALLLSAGDSNPYARWGVPLLDEGNWKKEDPLYMAAGLRGTGIYLSSGTTGLPSQEDTVGWTPLQIGEAFAGTIGNAYAARLKQLNIPATTHFYTFGEHAWASWITEMHTSYPLMMAAIGAQKV